MVEISVGAIEELDAWVGACKLPPAGDPRDGGAFIEQINWAEILHSFLHDQSNSQDLPFIVIRNQLCGKHFYYSIRELLLRICLHPPHYVNILKQTHTHELLCIHCAELVNRQVTNICIKIGLPGFDTGFDAFQAMSSLCHISLHQGRRHPPKKKTKVY